MLQSPTLAMWWGWCCDLCWDVWGVIFRHKMALAASVIYNLWLSLADSTVAIMSSASSAPIGGRVYFGGLFASEACKNYCSLNILWFVYDNRVHILSDNYCCNGFSNWQFSGSYTQNNVPNKRAYKDTKCPFNQKYKGSLKLETKASAILLLGKM